MGREMAGATAAAAAGRAAADWAVAGWAAGATLRVMTAAAVALPAAARLRMSFGYLRIDVLNEDKRNLWSGATSHARLSPGHMPATGGFSRKGSGVRT
jgi:hypothetical protein